MGVVVGVFGVCNYVVELFEFVFYIVVCLKDVGFF